MNLIRNEKIDLFFELFDSACMALYEDINIDYLEALIRVGNDLIFEVDDSRISEETYNKIFSIYNDLVNVSFTNEEIRLALELLIVKAFKHKNMPLDLMTPDTISYFISIIIEEKNINKKKISILDTLLGTSNLLQAISNNLSFESELIGIEKDENLVKISQISSNLQGNEMKIYYQNALNDINDSVDIVIGDLNKCSYEVDECDSYLFNQGVKYFPYLLIEKRLKNIVDDGCFIFIIDNDFFGAENNHIFKEFIRNNATLMALIVFPQTIVCNGQVGKSILIGKKAILDDYHMSILNVETFEKEYIRGIMQKIKQLVKDI